jgi:hypothetical protein
MSCRRSHEIDLPGFLEEAGAETSRAFREHYPRCVDCSAEVRAWTDLQLKLRGSDLSHPEPDVLLRFSDSRETLGSEQQGRVERHIASCAACRDELETLKHFDFPALNEPASGAEAAPWLSGLTDWLRRALWHPGLAYALVLILAIPLVAENWQATRIETLVANDRVAAIESLSKTQDGAPAAELKQKSRTLDQSTWQRMRLQKASRRSAPWDTSPLPSHTKKQRRLSRPVRPRKYAPPRCLYAPRPKHPEARGTRISRA